MTGTDLDTLVNDVCSHPAERSRLTALAPALTALAGEDPEAARITRRAAEHLAALAQSVRNRLGPLPADSGAAGAGPLPVAAPGGCSAPASSGTGSPS